MPFDFVAPAFEQSPNNPTPHFKLLNCFALLLFLLAPALAQSSAQAQDEAADDVLRVRTDLVTVPVFVLDNQGHRVAGLTQSDFSVRDNRREVALSYFAAGTERVALAFALDSSGSIREVVAAQREAAFKLFARFGARSRVAVLHFGDRANLTAPFTTEASRAEAAFAAHPTLSKRTAIFDAVAFALRAFAAEKGDSTERRILILISDGLDTASAARPATVINEARDLGVSIYVIHLPLYAPRDNRLEVRPAAKGFRDLASKTGGRYFLAGDAKSALDPPSTAPDLAPIFKAIEEDLQAQYVLGYYPDDATRRDASHQLEVTLTARDRRRALRVRALREEYRLKP